MRYFRVPYLLVFDALTHERPYKEAWPVAQAVAEIRYQSGKQFDPDIVDAFLSMDVDSTIAASAE